MFIVYDSIVIIIANRSNQNAIQVLYLKLYDYVAGTKKWQYH